MTDGASYLLAIVIFVIYCAIGYKIFGFLHEKYKFFTTSGGGLIAFYAVFFGPIILWLIVSLN